MNPIFSEKAPKPAGHYMQAWEHNGFIFISGQLPVDPETNICVTGSPAEQALQSLENLKSILEASGSNLSKVLKVTVYISDIAFWGEVNEVYSECFKKHKPARTIVPAGELHYGCKVEIDAIAAV